MSAERAVYLDSSALVKLVVEERESSALRRYLRDRPRHASCALARTEVPMAVRPHGTAALRRAAQVLRSLGLLALDDALLDRAGALDHPGLRSLDAIHLAAALSFGDEIESVVTYDRRLSDAATAIGLETAAPVGG